MSGELGYLELLVLAPLLQQLLAGRLDSMSRSTLQGGDFKDLRTAPLDPSLYLRARDQLVEIMMGTRIACMHKDNLPLPELPPAHHSTGRLSDELRLEIVAPEQCP